MIVQLRVTGVIAEPPTFFKAVFDEEHRPLGSLELREHDCWAETQGGNRRLFPGNEAINAAVRWLVEEGMRA